MPVILFAKPTKINDIWYLVLNDGPNRRERIEAYWHSHPKKRGSVYTKKNTIGRRKYYEEVIKPMESRNARKK